MYIYIYIVYAYIRDIVVQKCMSFRPQVPELYLELYCHVKDFFKFQMVYETKNIANLTNTNDIGDSK